MKLRATGDKILIQLEERKSTSSIVLVSDDSETRSGTVLSVGSEVSDTIALGERVLFGKFTGTEVQENIFVLKASDVLAIEEVA